MKQQQVRSTTPKVNRSFKMLNRRHKPIRAKTHGRKCWGGRWWWGRACCHGQQRDEIDEKLINEPLMTKWMANKITMANIGMK
jgi:hypothetical protein